MQIAVLGPLEVRDDTAALDVSGARLRLLLTVLAIEAPKAVSAAALGEALWQDEPPADVTNALQSLVSRLRKALGQPELIQQSPGGYRLAVAADDVDAHRFSALAAAGRDALRGGDAAAATELLTEALGLWRGDPVELTQSGYAGATLARLEEEHLDARADAIEAKLGLGAANGVIADLEGLTAAHPMRERFAALLIRALHGAGRQSEALASYERTRATLADELGVDPSAELRAAHLEALQGSPSEPAPTVRRHNLRATLTSFVGRDEQLVQIGNLLGAGRLVTLVGPGGAGKTRLAGAVAATTGDVARDGVWLAELAPVTDPADVPQAVLGALGIRDAILLERAVSPRDATTRLIDALAPWTAVLVLDNCEHLIDAAAQLADQLLAHCPNLRILATSREPLGIFGEALVVVPPLGQPEPDAGPKAALTFPAVQLFADRAADVQPGFEVDDDNVAAVIEIVRRLDGLPLAIELAAARLRSLPVAEIARRLSDRFRLLTGGSRTAMPRHRTLRAVVEWSWDLLSEPERALAERLAVFSGGVDPAAAAAVCCGADLQGNEIDDLLMSLVDKSLLQTMPSEAGAPRYRMLETIREFGIERMGDRGEVGAVRLAHANYFAEVVAAADPHLRRAEQLEWMALLRIERDNILAALKFFGDDGRAQPAISLVNLLGWYWMTIGDHGEIVTWVSFALAVDGEVDPWDRLMSETFLAINNFAWSDRGGLEDVQAGLDRLNGAINTMATSPTDAPPMMTLLAPIVAMFLGEDEIGELLVQRALASDDPWIAAAVQIFRATLAENTGDVVRMRADATQALIAFRAQGERWGMANCLQVMGQLELMEGNLAAAAAAYEEGLELATAVGGREDVAMMRLRLADVLTRLGDAEAAKIQIELGRDAAARSGSPLEVLFTHLVQVEIARGAGDVELAGSLRDEALVRLRQLPEAHPIQSHGLAVILSSAAKIALDRDDVAEAQDQLAEAYDFAIKSRDMPIVATVGVATALAAAHLGLPELAAAVLGASAQLRGADDFTALDIVTLDTRLGGLVDGRYADAYRRGRELDRDAAIAQVDPRTLRDL